MSKRKKPDFVFSLFAGLFLVLSTTTCTNTNSESNFSEQFSKSSNKADLLMDTNPYASLQIMDSVVRIIPRNKLTDAQVVEYLQLKSDAFVKLGRNDSAYSLMLHFYEGDPFGKNTSLKIHAGLWLARNCNANGKYLLAQKYLDHTLTLLENEREMYEKSRLTTESINERLQLINRPFHDNPVIPGIVLFFMLVFGTLIFRLYKLYRQRDEDYNLLFEKYRNETLTKAIPEMKVKPWEDPVTEMVKEEQDIIYPQLIEYFETGKPYLRSNLRFDDVANELRVNRKTLSHLIMKHTGMNFNSFVNNYRTKEAIRLLAEPKLKQYKIEAIAHKAGFGSKASFYLAFNQITGSIPSEHR